MALAIIQARLSSTRLPGKVLLPLAGHSVLSWVIRAARDSKVCDPVVVATSTEPEDAAIAEEALAQGAEIIRGPLDDVLTRFVMAADQFDGHPIVRLTADCPLLDPTLIRMAVRAFEAGDVDYLSTTSPRTLPRGLDVEVFSQQALRIADDNAAGVDRIHVTSYLYRTPNKFTVGGLTFTPPGDDLRVTLDTLEDLRLIEALVEVLGDQPPEWRHVVELLRKSPHLAELNKDVRQKSLEEG